MMPAVCNDRDRKKMHTHYGISFLPQTVQQAYIHHGQSQSGGSVWVHAHIYTHTRMYTPTHPRTHVHRLTPTPTPTEVNYGVGVDHTNSADAIQQRTPLPYPTTAVILPPPPTVSKLKNQTSSAWHSLTRWTGLTELGWLQCN